MSLFIASAHAQAEGAPPPGGEMFQILFLVGLFVLFYFIAIRPQRKRQKEHRQMVNDLQKGEEVITTGGILGKITSVNDDFITLEIAKDVSLSIQKNAVQTIMPKGTIKEQSK